MMIRAVVDISENLRIVVGRDLDGSPMILIGDMEEAHWKVAISEEGDRITVGKLQDKPDEYMDPNLRDDLEDLLSDD